jgi:hypothetical protein
MSIFKFIKRAARQHKIKKVCQKISLSSKGKLKFKLFIKRELKIN